MNAIGLTKAALGWAVLLAACVPSPSAVGTAIARTQQAEVTETPTATHQPAGASAQNSADCPVAEIVESRDALKPILRRWDEAMVIANESSRINLAEPVATLKTIRDDIQSTDVPGCMEAAKAQLVDSMKWAIQGFTDFMADKNSWRENFDKAEAAASSWADEVERIAACAPDCEPSTLPVP